MTECPARHGPDVAGGVRHVLALRSITQMIFGVSARALPVFAGRRLYSQRLVDVIFVLIKVVALTRVAAAGLLAFVVLTTLSARRWRVR